MPRSSMLRRWRATLIVTAAASLVLTACQSSAQQGSTNETSGPGNFPRTITHAMGQTEIESQPKTVAALDSSFADAAMALETPVAAYTRYPTVKGVPEYLSQRDRDFLANGKVVGELDSPNIEQLYGVAPDVIVSAKIRHEEIYTKLNGVAPTVFSETTGSTWKENIRLLARVLGKEQLAEQKISAYEQRAQQVGDQIKAKAGQGVTVTLARFTEGEPTVRLYSSASFPGIVLSDTGLRRPEGQPDPRDDISVDLGQEDITKLDADHIFVGTYQDPDQNEQNPKELFEANPLWATLKGTITEVDDTAWITSVSLQGAHQILDDLAAQFGVDPAR